MSLIIGVSGKKQGGKSTVVQLLGESLRPRSVTTVRFADFLKDIVLRCFVPSEWDLTDSSLDSDDVKNRVTPCGKTIRQLLQIVGTDWFRHTYSECWINAYQKEVENRTRAHAISYILTPDVRFPNELEAVHKMGGLVIRMLRAPFGDQDRHESETALDEIERFSLEVGGSIYAHPTIITSVGKRRHTQFDLVIDNRHLSMDEIKGVIHGPVATWIEKYGKITTARGGY